MNGLRLIFISLAFLLVMVYGASWVMALPDFFDSMLNKSQGWHSVWSVVFMLTTFSALTSYFYMSIKAVDSKAAPRDIQLPWHITLFAGCLVWSPMIPIYLIMGIIPLIMVLFLYAVLIDNKTNRPNSRTTPTSQSHQPQE